MNRRAFVFVGGMSKETAQRMLGENQPFLRKPFHFDDLTRIVRGVVK
jgi:hypothetical protein